MHLEHLSRPAPAGVDASPAPAGVDASPTPGSPRSSEPPNPGSPAAVEQGCICAVMDNQRGDPEFGEAHGFWITVGCPLHSPQGLIG